jgi:hypothetical protein
MKLNWAKGLTNASLAVLGSLILLLVLSPLWIVLAASAAYDSAPDAYAKWIRKNLGSTTSYSLEGASPEEIKNLKLDPELVAIAIATSEWLEEEHGWYIDPGMLLSIYQHECANGNNFGSHDGRYAATNHSLLNSTRQGDAVDWLMAHFKEYKIRDWSSVARKVVGAAYYTYKGAAAGEMGPGLIPTTAQQVCKQYLQYHPDYEVASCNFWIPKVGIPAEGVYLMMIGYDGKAEYQSKETELRGWNQSGSWRERLLSTAALINDKLADLGLTISSSNSYVNRGLRMAVTMLLDEVGLMPEDDVVTERLAGKFKTVARGEGQQYIDLDTDVPSSQVNNVLINAKLVNKITIRPGQQWGFCQQTNKGGWAKYNNQAGGICANASVIDNWCEQTPGCKVVYSKPHKVWVQWPIFTDTIWCTGGETAKNHAIQDLVIENTSDQVFEAKWFMLEDENKLVIQTIKGPKEAIEAE